MRLVGTTPQYRPAAPCWDGASKRKDEKEKMREKRRLQKGGGVGWGRGAAGEASAGLKIEGANDVQ